MTATTCQIDDCAKPQKAHGWCQMHYFRWRRHGSPDALVVEPWTDDEVEIIRKTANLTAKQVMQYVDRTWSSIRTMRKQLAQDEGLSFEKSPNANDPFCVGRRRLLAKTCLGCGLLLEARWFLDHDRSNGNRWSTQCTRCIVNSDAFLASRKRFVDKNREKIAAWNSTSSAKLQRITKDRASRNGFPWLEQDHEILRDTTLSIFEKALALGRTYAATSSACSENGYTSRVGKGDPMHGVWQISNPNEALLNK